jgi:hypothetical protein
MTDTTNNVFLTDSETGETMLNTEVTARLEAMFENAVASEAAKQTGDLLEAQMELAEAVDNIQGNIDEHFTAAEAAAETLTEQQESLVEAVDDYSGYVAEEVNRLQEENDELRAAVSVLAAQVFRGDLDAFYATVREYVSAHAVEGPGAKPGQSYSAGIPDGSAAKNRKSIAGRTGSVGTTPGGSETGGARLHEEVLVETTDGITSLADYRARANVAGIVHTPMPHPMCVVPGPWCPRSSTPSSPTRRLPSRFWPRRPVIAKPGSR